MERAVYEEMAALDERHWWYSGRREVLAALIERFARPPRGGQILEVGCGTGHNLPMLTAFGHVDAIELDDQSRARARERLGRDVMSARLPELSGVPGRCYDLVGAFDVIEHIDDDAAAIASIATLLKPGGKFIMTVPAHSWLWSAHDVVNHHKRRYSKRGLKALIEKSPLRLEAIGYFNSLLFPAAIAARVASKLRGKDYADTVMPASALNSAMQRTFAAERHVIGRVPLPPGLSLFAVASMQPVEH